MQFHALLSGDPEAADSGVTAVGASLSERDDGALLYWILIGSRLWSVRLRGSSRMSTRLSDRRNPFVLSGHTPAVSSPGTLMTFPQFCLKTEERNWLEITKYYSRCSGAPPQSLLLGH